MAPSPLALAAALCLLAAIAGWLLKAWLPLLKQLRPVVLEPEGLQERLAAMSRRRLSASEIEAFDREGILILRGLLPARRLLRQLHPFLRQHQQMERGAYYRPWLYNGVVRSVVRDGSLTEPLVDLLRGPSVLMEAPIWGTDGNVQKLGLGQWHADVSPEKLRQQTMITAWLAITDAPHGLEFIRGTLDAEMRLDLFRECNMSSSLGLPGERLLDNECTRRFAKERLDPKLGRRAFSWLDLAAGDLVIFHGNMVHRGMSWPRSRLALSLRLARPLQDDGSYDDALVRRWCKRGEVALFPRGAPEEAKSRDPLECIREVLLVKPDAGGQVKALRLPLEKELGPNAQLARRVAASVLGALLSV